MGFLHLGELRDRGGPPRGHPICADPSDFWKTTYPLSAAGALRGDYLWQVDHVSVSQIPPDAVTASASGLDPDISPQYADIQVARVAAARHLPAATVQALVSKYTQGRTIGFLGEPRVNVLELNIALDQLTGK